MDLKPYYDAALAADAEVQRILAEMDAAFNSGDEGKLQALEMRPALDQAKAKAKEANDLYISMRNASLPTGNEAARFTPVSTPEGKPEDQPKATSMKRAEFDALDHTARTAFMRSGGALED